MIHYFVTAARVGSIRLFLESWGKCLAPRMRVVTYESLLAGREQLPEQGGVYIFTNLGLVNAMSQQARSAICDLHDRLVETRGANKVLNDPARSLRRYDLLKCMYERGINTFDAFRASDASIRPRFPVFVRDEMRNELGLPVLAADAVQYASLLRGTRWIAGSLAGYMTVEFCDTKDSAGIYRKYGAFIVGDRTVPRHILFSRNWHIRSDDLVEPAMVEEELRFLDTNPHSEALLECARLARVSYGRVDYALLDGRPQIWEINSNAGLVFEPAFDRSLRQPVHRNFVEMFAAAMAALDEENA
jgi:hypothetical protein